MHTDHAFLVGACRLARPEGDTDLATRPWNPHPRFAGVALRHLLTAADTGGAMSTHLVRIDAGAELSSHVHEGNLELHEVVRGAGVGTLGGREAAYQPGTCGLIPPGMAHSVRAHAGEDLYILAKFAPALL
ncbi:MAG: cupin domain-containing protein [Proteobacteria bacterium]|nr:cupin domain-containing protein [Pseudomonadota bacterium]MBU1595673.1 cupin domain-containing protein [Pseudomonadota bacterium]